MTALVAGVAAALAAWCAAAVDRSSTQRAGLQPPRGSVPVLAAGGCIAAVAGSFLLGLSIAFVVALSTAAAIAWVIARRGRRSRGLTALNADVATFCFAVAAEVRSGRMPADAIAATLAQLGPLGVGMSAVARAAGHGAPLDGELASLAAHLSSERLETVAAVWSAAAATGARVADVLERVAVAFTAEDEALADMDALAAGPRATAMVLCLLPLVGIALATVMGAHPLALLLHSAFGGLLLVVAVLLDTCGWLWVRTVTTRALHG